jgi:NADH:ubiquinone oxidoreductase subunit 5 (subunit L)/multisubunit Na+/H+ antiporter MnhA subunit
MCAGGVIQSIGDSQDMRFMGGLSIYMPFTSSCLMVPNFAVRGILFLPGFYSKDFILEMFSMRYVNICSSVYLKLITLFRKLILGCRVCERYVSYRWSLRTVWTVCIYRGAEKTLARPTSRCILFDGENISFDDK